MIDKRSFGVLFGTANYAMDDKSYLRLEAGIDQ